MAMGIAVEVSAANAAPQAIQRNAQPSSSKAPRSSRPSLCEKLNEAHDRKHGSDATNSTTTNVPVPNHMDQWPALPPLDDLIHNDLSGYLHFRPQRHRSQMLSVIQIKETQLFPHMNGWRYSDQQKFSASGC